MSPVACLEVDEAVLRKGRRLGLAAGDEQRQQPWEMREVAHDKNAKNAEDPGLVRRPEGLFAESIPHPRRRIPWLEVACRGEGRQRVARAPEGFGRLLRPQFSAVPDGRRLDAARGCQGCEPIDVYPADERQRPARVHVRANGIAMMNERQLHECHNTLGT